VVRETRLATFDDVALEGRKTDYDKGFDEQTNSYGEYMTRPGEIWVPADLDVEPLETETQHSSTAFAAARRLAPDGLAALR
jgi:hypothetical protein